MPVRPVESAGLTAVPAELGGKWVVWNAEHTQIIARAETLQQLWIAVKEKKIDDPVFEKVPRANVRFVGTQ